VRLNLARRLVLVIYAVSAFLLCAVWTPQRVHYGALSIATGQDESCILFRPIWTLDVVTHPSPGKVQALGNATGVCLSALATELACLTVVLGVSYLLAIRNSRVGYGSN